MKAGRDFTAEAQRRLRRVRPRVFGAELRRPGGRSQRLDAETRRHGESAEKGN
jgi:hypothetical protein